MEEKEISKEEIEYYLTYLCKYAPYWEELREKHRAEIIWYMYQVIRYLERKYWELYGMMIALALALGLLIYIVLYYSII